MQGKQKQDGDLVKVRVPFLLVGRKEGGPVAAAPKVLTPRFARPGQVTFAGSGSAAQGSAAQGRQEIPSKKTLASTIRTGRQGEGATQG